MWERKVTISPLWCYIMLLVMILALSFIQFLKVCPNCNNSNPIQKLVAVFPSLHSHNQRNVNQNWILLKV